MICCSSQIDEGFLNLFLCQVAVTALIHCCVELSLHWLTYHCVDLLLLHWRKKNGLGIDQGNVPLQALRYQLQCLFLHRREARSGPFFHACQKLNRAIADLSFDSLMYSITIHSDLFILRQPVHINHTCNLETEASCLDLWVGNSLVYFITKW